MRRLLAPLAVLALLLPASAAAIVTPGRTVANAAEVTALSVTHRSVVWAVGRSRRDCGHVRLWDTATRGLWSFGGRTIVGCEEGPSGGFGISQVSLSGRRAFWVTHVGGNTTDYQLWTATPTRPAPRRLAFASAGTDRPSAIVLGPGTLHGVAYALGATVTYVSAAGVRLFRVTLDSPVELLTAGTTFGSGRVVAALADGRIVLLSGDGVVLDTETFEPATVRSVALAYTGPVVQVDHAVHLTQPNGRPGVIMLPAGALMLDYRQRAIYYRQGRQARVRLVGTGADTLLTEIPVRPWQPMLFSVDWGAGWGIGKLVNWRT